MKQNLIYTIDSLKQNDQNSKKIFNSRKIESNNYLTPSTKDVEETRKRSTKSLHQILKPIFIVAQCFTIFPLDGITASTPTQLKFSFLSIRLLLSLVSIFGILNLAIFSLFQLFESSVNFYRSIGVSFFAFAMLILILFIKLAHNWPKLMQEWTIVEMQLRHYDAYGNNIQFKIYLVVVIIGSLAIFEHSLSLANTRINTDLCISSGDKLQGYFELRFNYVFRRLKFTYWKGFFCIAMNLVATFAWNFLDLFLIIISMALTELFERITKRIKEIHIQVVSENTWRTIREDYNKVALLCRSVDNCISDMILLSFANNLLFICAQLLHSIAPIFNLLDGLYFFYSMFFLVGRTILLTLMASKVNESSRAPINFLFNIPAYSYCQEVTRFIQQIGADNIALTGMNFFVVRKAMLLSVLGTIITYELVLVQFRAFKDDEDLLLKNTTVALQPCVVYVGD